MLLKLLRESVPARWHAEVICLGTGGPIADAIQQLGIPVNALGIRGAISGSEALLRLRRAVASSHPDLLQGWMYHGNFAASIAAALTSRERLPIIWNVRRALNTEKREKWTTEAIVRLCARLSKRADAVIYNSHAGRQSHIERAGFSDHNALVIPNGFDTAIFSPSQDARLCLRRELGVDPETPIIGMVAGYRPPKDHCNFIAAAAKVAHHASEPHFLLVGSGTDSPELKQLIAESGAANRFHLFAETQRVDCITAALDVAVSASYVEGFSNALGEALCCEVPCVATDVGDSAKIVGESGLIVPPRDSDALATAILNLLAMPARARQVMGQRGRENMIRNYSIQAITSRYHALYFGCLQVSTNAAK